MPTRTYNDDPEDPKYYERDLDRDEVEGDLVAEDVEIEIGRQHDEEEDEAEVAEDDLLSLDRDDLRDMESPDA